MEKVWRLRIFDVGLHHANVVGHVTVGSEYIQQSIKIVVKKEDRERQRLCRHFSDPGVRRFISEKAGSIIPIERHALVREIPHDNSLLARSVKITSIDTHAGTRSPGITKGHTRCDRLVSKGSVPVILVKLVWLGVVSHEEIHPTIAVVVKQCDAERFAGGIVEPCFLCDVLKSSIAFVVIKG